MLGLDQTIESKISKYSFIGGFATAFIGYSFHKFLWHYAFYHLIALSFCLYIFSTFITEKNKVWNVVKFSVLMTALNSLSDEIRGIGAKFDIGEYILFIIILLYTIYILLNDTTTNGRSN